MITIIAFAKQIAAGVAEAAPAARPRSLV